MGTCIRDWKILNLPIKDTNSVTSHGAMPRENKSSITIENYKTKILEPTFAEPLFIRMIYRSPPSENNTMIEPKPIIVEPTFAEPVFTGKGYGNPASKDYMMIEPLFLEFSPQFEKKLTTPPNLLVNEEAVLDGVDMKCYSVESVKCTDVVTNDVNDVTILPADIKSYLQTICLVSARRKRLKGLCNAATWRAIKLMGGWVCIILLVFWLSSIFGLSIFPTNPLKYFLTQKREKTKSKK